MRAVRQGYGDFSVLYGRGLLPFTLMGEKDTSDIVYPFAMLVAQSIQQFSQNLCYLHIAQYKGKVFRCQGSLKLSSRSFLDYFMVYGDELSYAINSILVNTLLYGFLKLCSQIEEKTGNV